MSVPTPEVPPSVEHLAHEARRWLDTPVARKIGAVLVADIYAGNLAARMADVPPQVIGEVLLRTASLLANEPDMPLWLAVNSLAAAGADLIERKTDDV